MIINEIISQYRKILKNDWSLSKIIINYLEENNFKLLGAGYYSEVFGKDNANFVIKIGLKSKDDGYLNFVDYIISHKNNPHLPKIGKIRYHLNFYIIPIEKLYPVQLKIICYNELSKLHHHDNPISYIHYLKELNIFPETFLDTLKDLYKIYSVLDLNPDNIMQRKDGTLVISDPIEFKQ